MRKLIIFLALLLILGGAAWLGGETWLAGQVSRAVRDDPRITAAEIVPLREASRIGIRTEQIQFQDDSVTLTFPAFDLWASPLRLNDFKADLPSSVSVVSGGREIDVALQNPTAHLRIAPLNEMAVGAAGLVSGPVTLNGQPAVSGVSVEATLANLSVNAPLSARAAYDIDLRVDQASPAALAIFGPSSMMDLPTEPVSVQGRMRAYLTGAPGVATMQTPAQIGVVGIFADDLRLSVGNLGASVAGRLIRGDDDLAEGRIYVDTADSRAFLQLAADTGMIPPSAVTLGTGLLSGLSDLMVESDPTSSEPSDFNPPPVAKGSIRLEFVFRDGQTWLAGQSIGPAPMFGGTVPE